MHEIRIYLNGDTPPVQARLRQTMMNGKKWTALQQAEDMACFEADLCCYSPESCSLEQRKAICNDMASTSKAMLDAMRANFEQPPADARRKPLSQ